MTSVNLSSDYGGVGDDSTSNDTPFTNYRTAARSAVDTVTLTIPAGIYRIATQTLPFDGVGSQIVSAAGATLKYMSNAPRLTCHSGIVQSNSIKHAFVAAVSKDAEFLTCLTPSEAGRFPVGQYAYLSALEWQGTSGFPPNHHYNQFVKVLSADTNTGVVTFTPPAKFDYGIFYPRTFPPGNSYVTGGPACLIVVDKSNADSTSTSFDTDTTINGLNVVNAFDPVGGPYVEHQIYIPGRRIVLNDMVFTGCAPIPTASLYTQFNRVTVPDVQIEVDKAAGYVEVNDSEIHQLTCQSSSVDALVVDGTHVENINGTPKNLVVRNGSTIDALSIGAAYGNTDSILIEDSIVSAIDWRSSQKSAVGNFSWEQGGSLTYTADGVLPFGAEGTQLFLAGQSLAGSNFEHIGFPTWVRGVGDVASKAKLFCWLKEIAPSILQGTVFVVQHPCRNVTFRNVTGCPESVDLSNAPDGLPLFSFSKRTDQDFGTAQLIKMWGRLVYMKINVTRADTGGNPTAPLHIGGQNNNIKIINSAGAFTSYGPIVNTKITGLRTITPTSVTGGQSGDTLGSAPGNIEFVDTVEPFLNANISGYTAGQKPLVTFEMLTDQFQVVGRLV